MRLKLNFDDLPIPLVGVDEVGRGCLAGPVVAGAVIFKSNKDIKKYRDSKELPEERREELSESIHLHHTVAIGWASVEEIDEFNILQATFIAMKRAIASLEVQSGSILVDGRDRIPNQRFVRKMEYLHIRDHLRRQLRKKRNQDVARVQERQLHRTLIRTGVSNQAVYSVACLIVL